MVVDGGDAVLRLTRSPVTFHKLFRFLSRLPISTVDALIREVQRSDAQGKVLISTFVIRRT